VTYLISFQSSSKIASDVIHLISGKLSLNPSNLYLISLATSAVFGKSSSKVFASFWQMIVQV